MSYDLTLSVKVEGHDVYARVARPEKDHPTYNVGEIFRKAMDWDYSQSDDDGKTCYYPAEQYIPNIERGIHEMRFNAKKYKPLEPDNGWGSTTTVLECLESLLKCIQETVEWEGIPLECLYISW